MNRPLHATLVSHTHWDRAWYVTFQEYRIRLVRLVDRLLNLLQTRTDYRVYMLDGQMAVLEDYLEVRPQRAAKLQALCRQGRIQVGPWYVLADEFLVSPEALIRNLMVGYRMGADYGGVVKLGYVPDGFGHIAQLPQILRGFGIDSAFFWRGLGAEGERLGTEFEWRAPDGSSVTTIWMPWGYHNVSNIGYPIHWGDTSQMEFSGDTAQRQIRNALEALKPMANTPALLLMNGIDHAEAEPRIPEIIARANAESNEVELADGTLADHLARVRRHGQAPRIRGEFRWGRYSEILQGVYPRDPPQADQSPRRIPPGTYYRAVGRLAWLAGADVPAGTHDLIWTAWRWLLKNHPHDDIYGSGIDAVHDEMLYRFSQAEQIGRFLVRDSLRQIARQADLSAQTGVPVLVFNPLSWERREQRWVTSILTSTTRPPAISSLWTARANQCLHQVLSDEPAFWMETLKPNRKRRVRVAFPAAAPACGYRRLLRPAAWSGLPIPRDDWRVAERGAENR